METYQINGIQVHGEISWTRIGEPVDMENDYEMAMVYGMDANGIAVSYTHLTLPTIYSV